MATEDTIASILARSESSDLAISGQNEVALSFREVLRLADGIAHALSGFGIQRSDRLAIATANGPAAALSFLGTSLAAVAAAINPSYRRAEFKFAFADLPARALLSDGTAPEASAAARRLGIPELRLSAEFCLEGSTPAPYSAPKPSDIALVLHTSGTTGVPKRVPLTHANLARSAATIAATLALTPADRALNVMPLFHIHGLVGCLLSSLSARSSVVCTPGFDAFKMAGWLEGFRPTWYSAVPTMHQAILSRAKGGSADSAKRSLRFIRFASSALSPSLMAEVETAFGVPVIEAYGMTEASHQVASNPLPPAKRRPGSVGTATGVEVGVFAAGGSRVVAGSPGEVGIRGPSVTSGYEGVDPGLVTFRDGWLRTGDEGRVDSEGYLWLTGRLKELINRGGEKVSPREVEEALLAHPSVAEAVVFAVPHEKLGEEVAAAVVRADGAQVDPRELREFLGERLAAFKVPRKIASVDQIPLGPTGKPQRLGIAARLGLEGPTER